VEPGLDARRLKFGRGGGCCGGVCADQHRHRHRRLDPAAGAGLPLEPQVAEAVRAGATLFEQAGAVVDPVAPLLTPAMLAGIDRFWQMRSHLELKALEPERRTRVLPFIRDWAARRRRALRPQVFEAFSQMDAIAVVAATLMREYEFVLSPVAPVAAFAADLPSPTDDPRRALEHIGFTVPFSMSGQPAVSVPAAMLPDGRPIGLQIAGRRFADVETLAAAALFEQLRPPLPPDPDAPPQA
jgi:aspartyl-tRNA(Asn)/glutamyl-tRNA(Gln) amidotransferase subunit A